METSQENIADEQASFNAKLEELEEKVNRALNNRCQCAERTVVVPPGTSSPVSLICSEADRDVSRESGGRPSDRSSSRHS